MRIIFINKLLQGVDRYAPILMYRRSILTVGFSLLGLLVFYAFPWKPERLLLIDGLASMFSLWGHHVIQDGTYLAVDGFVTHITRECTYIDLLLVTIPFTWRGPHLGHNLFRMLIFAAAVLILNFIRVYLAISWHLDGIAWKYSHNLVDTVIYYPLIVLMILFWLEAERVRTYAKLKKNEYEK